MTEAAVRTVDDSVEGPHGPIPIRRYEPSTVSPSGPPIVWIHGGAFVSGGLRQPESDATARALAAVGYPVVTVAYRLATRLPIRRPWGASWSNGVIRYPLPLDDVVAVVEQVQRENPAGVILGGASAGACLAAGAVLRLAASGADPLLATFFAYGTFHAVLPAISPELRSRLLLHRRMTHTRSTVGLMALNYAGSRAAMAEPFAFPGGHALDGFPPTLMLDADRDVLRASGERFAAELASAGVPVEYRMLEGTSHAFLNRPRDPGFAAGIRLIGEWAAKLRV